MRYQKRKGQFLAILLAGAMMMGCCGCRNAGDSDSSAKPVTSSGPAIQENADPNGAEQADAEQADAGQQPADKDEIEAHLKDVFAAHGMKVGTCLTTRMTTNVEYSNLITSQFNSITMENAMKPDSVLDKKASKASGELVVAFNKDMIRMLDWAKNNQMAVRGHTFVWYSQTPAWIFHEDFDLTKPLSDRDVMLARMESFFKQMFSQLEEGGYSELFYAYDIVNEAWMEDGQMRMDGNLWYQTVGPDYLWYAFYYANQYAPEHIDLYYNDYNEQYKADTLVKFVDTLKDEEGNYLIDGIGLQAHLYTSDDLTRYFAAMDKLADTGLKLEMTELDVCLGAWQNTKEATDENLQMQGRYYYNLINGIFERVDNGSLQMDSLTFWGFTDAMSWRSEGSPLLFNIRNKPKYAFYGAAQIKDKAGF